MFYLIRKGCNYQYEMKLLPIPCFDTAPFTCVKMRKVQGAKTEAQRSELNYPNQEMSQGNQQFAHYHTPSYSLCLTYKLS